MEATPRNELRRSVEENRTISTDLAAAYQQPVEDVIAALSGDAERGLTTEEARRRLAHYGPNELQAEPPIPAWRKFLAQFQDVLIILLLIAAAISLVVWLYERDEPLPFEALVIFAIVLLNGILGYVQEARAERSVAALQAMAAAEASVLRDGQLQRVPATNLVPGDIIAIEEGDTLPADGRLIRSVALQIAEASLTGESLPVSKNTAPLTDEVGIGDRRNSVFSGTTATYGRGRAVLTATGMQTEMGKIAGLLHQSESEETPLQQELDRTGKLLGIVVVIIAVVMVLTIILVEGVREFSALVDVLILGVALAVAAVPEGLPAVVTAVLALGVQRMAKRKAIVRKLPAVETLGSATVIASDKTGTLTKNEMTVRTVVTASGRVDVSGTGYAPEGELRQDGHALEDETLRAEVSYTLGAADRANNAVLQERDGRWIIQGDPTEGALIVAARKVGRMGDPEGRYARVGEVPFSSERKLMTTINLDPDAPDRLFVFTKGAPDILLSRCDQEWAGDELRPMTDERRAQIREVNEQLAGEALRTLGIAFRSLASLVALVVPSLLVVLLGWESVQRVVDVSPIPRSIPTPTLPNLALFTPELLLAAFSIAVVIAVQGAGVSQSVENPDGSSVNPSRDMVAQGVANVASGLLSGIPAGGSVGQTALNVSVGARSRWSGVLGGVWMLAIVLLVPVLVGQVPMAVLAALMIQAGVSAIDLREARSIWNTGGAARWSILATFLATLMLSVPLAVAVGVLLTVVLYLASSASDVTVREIIRLEGGRYAESDPAAQLPSNKVTVLDVNGSLFFAGARTLQEALPRPVGATRPVVVLRLRGYTHVGAPLIEVLDSYADALAGVGGRLYLSGVDADVSMQLRRAGKLDLDQTVQVVPGVAVIGASTRQAFAHGSAWLGSTRDGSSPTEVNVQQGSE